MRMYVESVLRKFAIPCNTFFVQFLIISGCNYTYYVCTCNWLENRLTFAIVHNSEQLLVKNAQIFRGRVKIVRGLCI